MKKITLFSVATVALFIFLFPTQASAQSEDFLNIFKKIQAQETAVQNGVETVLLPNEMLKIVMPKQAGRTQSVINRTHTFYQIKINRHRSNYARERLSELATLSHYDRAYTLYVKSSADNINYEIYQSVKNHKNNKKKEYLIRIDNQPFVSFFNIVGYITPIEVLNLILQKSPDPEAKTDSLDLTML